MRGWRLYTGYVMSPHDKVGSAPLPNTEGRPHWQGGGTLLLPWTNGGRLASYGLTGREDNHPWDTGRVTLLDGVQGSLSQTKGQAHCFYPLAGHDGTNVACLGTKGSLGPSLKRGGNSATSCQRTDRWGAVSAEGLGGAEGVSLGQNRHHLLRNRGGGIISS